MPVLPSFIAIPSRHCTVFRFYPATRGQWYVAIGWVVKLRPLFLLPVKGLGTWSCRNTNNASSLVTTFTSFLQYVFRTCLSARLHCLGFDITFCLISFSLFHSCFIWCTLYIYIIYMFFLICTCNYCEMPAPLPPPFLHIAVSCCTV